RSGRSLQLTTVDLAGQIHAGDVDRIEVRGREGRVVHRHAIDDEQRLARAIDRAQAANLYRRAGAGIARRLLHLHVRRFAGEGLDDIRFVGLHDQVGGDGVAHVAELFDFRRRAGAGDHHLAELQRIRLEIEVLHEIAAAERDAGGLGLVADAPRRQRDRLTDDTRAGNAERVAAVV